ncbi:MAG: type IV secretion system protein [Candidatus Pacebacteria bacterium]|nr:type IV secretion system protein [Candidatus Paceibacterota bacterium]MCF7857324.1 type IV secretion system protein [Candidatus Paceibacterota bacterium]
MILKKILPGFLVFCIIFAPVSVSLFAVASNNSTQAISLQTSRVSAQIADMDPTEVTADAAKRNAAAAPAATKAKPSAPKAEGNAPSTSWEAKFGLAILSTAAMVTWLGGNILETAVEELVFKMGDKMTKSPLGETVNNIWKLIRDIANLAFIFGFIFLGIRTILDPGNSSFKSILSKIIIGALLINFSLFFTKVVIDFSNLTASQIYTSIISDTRDSDISSKFAQQLGITTFYTQPKNPEVLNRLTSDNSLWFYVMASIMLVVAGFVLAAGGVLLIVRFVALILIMIFSPILFAATVFPKTAAQAGNLWGKLISYSFFAPAYLLLLLISISVLSSVTAALNISSGDSFVNAFTGSGSLNVILNFVIVIMFLIFSLQLAQKMGIKGGDMVVGKTKEMIGATTAGLAARTGRATIGWGAHKISERESLKDTASKRGAVGFLARRALKGTRAVGDASFDARNVGGVGRALGIGDGRKGGYTTVKKEVEEKEMKFAKSLGEVDDTDPVVARYKDLVTTGEAALVRAKEKLDDLPKGDPGRAAQRTAIRTIENTIKENKQKYEQEKQRRVLGSTNFGKTDEMKNKYKELRADIKKSWDDFKKITNAEERKLARGLIETMEKQATNLKREISSQGIEGYAAVLEKSNFLSTWPVGRLLSHEHAAGKAIRKAFNKLIKKTKEDARNDALVDALKNKS